MKKLILFFAFGLAIASAQSAPSFTISAGTTPTTQLPCSGPQNVGSIYTLYQNPANGFSGPYVCTQIGAASLGAGAYGWMALSQATGTFCGTTSTCAATNTTGTLKVVSGQAPLVSGTPSTVTITGIPAFTSTTSFACTVTNMTTAANSALKVVNTSASSITITGPNTLSDVLAYVCVGS